MMPRRVMKVDKREKHGIILEIGRESIPRTLKKEANL